MHNVEIEDFYHHDFTTASEWEVFIARLEEIIHEWKLPHSKIEPALKPGDFLNSTWQVKSEELNFANYPFLLKHFKLKTPDSDDVTDSSDASDEDPNTQSHIDILNITNDFVRIDQDHLEIARYYGIREFILLTPGKRISISDETRIKILVSSLTIASTNANCEVPALVQVQEPWQKYYLGISVGKGTMTHLDMVHLKKTPPHCRHLTGLLALFKQKIGEGSGVRLDPVMVSIRFTYGLRDWLMESSGFDFMKGRPVINNELGKLPFGAEADPVSELQVYATWPQMSENIVVDSESFTDLEPQLATEWSARVRMAATPPSLLEEYLKGFLSLCSNQKSLVDIMGDTYVDNDQMLSSAFNVVTESKIPTISKVMSRASYKKTNKNDGPIPDDVLMMMLYYLFPDADEQSKALYDENGSNVDEDLWKGIKTCALDSLVWRLAVVTAHCRQNLGGITAVAQIWHEFVQEMRYRWDESILIPGVGTGFPDSVRTCLLHQKLQMINCCIERKNRRNEFASKPLNIDSDLDSESEEEFFECEEDQVSIKEEQVHKKTKHLLWNKPTGRLSKHPSLRLLKTGDALYLPVTQDPVPKTEDQLEEDAQLMMQLGTDKQGSEMRARLMSASLLSDMESFKAANPGSELEDFIRWYSPRDWIEEEGTDEWGQINGHLSPRMKIPNNPWATTWNSAQPVPAHRQKRLFDDTKEAEKTIQFLACRRIGEICQLLMPVLTHAALHTLAHHNQQAITQLPEIISGMTNKLQRATKSFHLQTHLYEDIISDISTIKVLLTQYNSLLSKFPGETEETIAFILKLMQGKEVFIPGGPRGPIGLKITEMFRNIQKATYMMDIPSSGSGMTGAGDEKQKTFPEPSSKEFILRAVTPRPSPTSTPQPQRLYVNLKRESIRLAGYFSDDTTFL
ncbi:rab3 GTPase-activating protein catalytic subunit [Microplitis demolitor]|uniref:rab3 GTPase-activating protein catalytic subunit n=1 Tax=Microplitis demolitor TaxID=69319 RepID=UPI0004CDA065|nr:rab3 GTPase-activating protein catalytic subunit [Microplitis demolitor]